MSVTQSVAGVVAVALLLPVCAAVSALPPGYPEKQ